MRRFLAGSLATVAFSGVLLVLPVYANPSPEAVPVEVAAEQVELGSVEHPAGAADVQQGTTEPVAGVSDTAPTLTVSRTDVDEFSMVSVTWAYDPAVTDTVAHVRVLDAADRWGEWTEVGTEDAGPDLDARADVDRRGATAPLWTGPSQGVEVELVTRSGAAPVDVQVELIDPGSSAADGSLGAPDIQDTADAAMAMPDVYSRAQWGADENLMKWTPEYAPTIKAATLHHTASSNNYTAADVPAILRGIYYSHAVSNGWGDIGYNVVVDKFGRLWEGRAGGLSRTVIGAHAGGFNTGTFGVSMLGNYDVVNTTQPMVDSVAAITAWKFSLYGVDPRGSTTLVSGGGGTARYARGTPVTLPTVFGHRDVGSTACPGQYGYARLPEIRDRVSRALATTQSISGRYSSEPALRALLGAPVGEEQSSGDVTWQGYTNGRLYASPGTGVHAVVGAILTAYLQAGGHPELGAPTTDELGGPDGVGRFNHFAREASIYWTPTLGAHVVRGAIRDWWKGAGWETGVLGYPLTDELGAPGGVRYSSFERGSVYWSQATGAHAVVGAIAQRWTALGGLAWGYGIPTTDELVTPDGGRLNHFSGGASIYWSQATGAHAVQGSIRTLWSAQGWERGVLGYPTSDELAVPQGGGARYSTFQNGVVSWSSATGTHAVQGAVEDRWTALGGPAWDRGLPTTDELTPPDGVGRFNHFARETSIYWSPQTGAHAVSGAIRSAWAAQGWERGSLGYPVGEEKTAPDGTRYQTFQNGVIRVTGTAAASTLTGPVVQYWGTLGGPAWSGGSPTTAELRTPDGVGRFMHFSGNASIYWTPATGAHAVVGAVRQKWEASGWERGPLGYPVSDERETAEGIAYQTFERGIVYRHGSVGVHVVQGAIEDRWTALGGLGWDRGLPTTDELVAPDGIGRFNHFAGNASIYWTPATGAQPVQGAIRDAWTAQGWERGRLGYPAADQQLAADGVTWTQQFQGGLVVQSRTSGTHVLYGAIARAYVADGGVRSPLGLPTGPEQVVPGGRRSTFQHGSITWNTATDQVTITRT